MEIDQDVILITEVKQRPNHAKSCSIKNRDNRIHNAEQKRSHG